MSTLRGLLSELNKFTFDEDPVLPVTDEGSIFIPDAALLFELTADVRVPIRLEAPIWDDGPVFPLAMLPVPPKLIPPPLFEDAVAPLLLFPLLLLLLFSM